ncbi:MAG: carbohydrate binding domain-containing protein [Fibrobacterales bacterium]
MKIKKIVLILALICGTVTAVQGAVSKLHRCENTLCDSDDNIVVLRGVSIADAKFTGTLRNPIAGHYSNELADTPENQLRATIRLASDASKGWHSNLIRVPIHPIGGGWPFAGWNEAPEEWTSFIDAAVDECELQDIYCILDYHAINNWNYSIMGWAKVAEFWSWAADRYRNNPNVIFEIYNEPVSDDNCSSDDCGPNGDIAWSTFKDDIAQPMVDFIRNTIGATENLILVSSPWWTQMLKDINDNPIEDPAAVERIAYTLHVYPWHWYEDATLASKVGETVNNYPVVVTEFGYQDGTVCPFNNCDGSGKMIDQDGFGQFIKQYMKDHNMSWTAWAFDNAFESIMFTDDQFTTLAEGPGYMGRYVKDFLAEEKDNYLPCNPCVGSGRPTANAGVDQVIIDSDQLPGEPVTLSGSAVDTDGTIEQYEWKEADVVLGTGASIAIALDDGIHTISLTVTDNDGRTHTDNVLINVQGSTFEPCTNILTNSSFDDGMTGWDNWVEGTSGQGTFTEQSGELHADITQAGLDWQIQVWNSTSIESGKEYVVKYRARATGVRDLILMIEQNGAPYQAVTSAAHTLSTTMTQYSHTFTSAFSFADLKVGFKLGGNGTNDVIIDDVVFAETESCIPQDAEAPSIPQNVALTTATLNSLEISWNPSTDNTAVVGYDVYVGTALVQSVNTPNTTLDGLTIDSEYAIQIVAKDAAGNRSAKSSAQLFRTLSDSEAPSVPAGLVAGTVTHSTIALQWNASTDNVAVEGYNLYINGTLARTLSNVLSTVVSGLTPETLYSITVSAIDVAENESVQGSAVVVTTDVAPDVEAPSQPGPIVATGVSMTTVDVAWTAATDNVGVESYQIFVNGGYYNEVTNLFATVISLSYNTEYSITVYALDAARNISSVSAALVVTTEADTEAPTAPVITTASTTGMTTVDVAWTASQDNIFVEKYIVYVDGVEVQDAGTALNITLSGLTANTEYSIQVEAVDPSDNRSGLSSEVLVTTDEKPLQEALLIQAESYSTKHSSIQSEVTADIGGGENIGWTAAGRWVSFSNQTLAPGQWKLETRLATWESNRSFDLLIDGVKATTFTKGSATYTGSGSKYQTWNTAESGTFTIANGDQHTVRLNFTTGSQNINWIRFVPVIPDTEKPSVVNGVSEAGVTASTVSLNWNAASDNVGVTAYAVYQDGLLVTTVSGTSASVTGLQALTSYGFSVEAIDAAGNRSSTQSAALTITTSEVRLINLLSNGDFSGGTSGWECSNYGGAATCAVLSGQYAIAISNPGTSDWNVQPKQAGFTLETGKTYTFAYDGKASVSRLANIKIETDGSPWTDYTNIGSGAALATAMQRYVYTFTMTQTAAARVVLNIGNNGANTVTVDNMWLVEGTTDPCGATVGCSE